MLGIRDELPIDRLLRAQTLQKLRNDLPHVWQVHLECLRRRVLRQTLLEHAAQLVRNGHQFAEDHVVSGSAVLKHAYLRHVYLE